MIGFLLEEENFKRITGSLGSERSMQAGARLSVGHGMNKIYFIYIANVTQLMQT
jgi:hypothetical protein